MTRDEQLEVLCLARLIKAAKRDALGIPSDADAEIAAIDKQIGDVKAAISLPPSKG